MIRSERPLWRASVGLLAGVALAFAMMPQLVNGVISAIKAPSTGGYIASGVALAVWISLSALSLFAVGSQALRLRWLWFRALGVGALFLAMNLTIWNYSASLDSDNLTHAAPYLFVFIAVAAAAPPKRALRFIDRCPPILTLSACLLFALALSVGWIRIPL